MKIAATFLVEECQKLIDNACACEYDAPGDCLEVLDKIRDMFTDAVMQKYRYDDLSMSTKNSIDYLLKLCSPCINYEMTETFKWDENARPVSIEPIYKMSITTTGEEIACQADEFYALAVKSLTNPLLKQGVTPRSILMTLVDRYSQEAGVDDPEEIAGIVKRLLNRLFAEYVCEDAGNQEVTGVSDTAEPSPYFARIWVNSLADIADGAKEIKEGMVLQITKECELTSWPNKGSISKLARWLALPSMKIKVNKDELKPYIDFERKQLIFPFPKMSYMAIIDKDVSRKNVKSYLDIVEKMLTDSIIIKPLDALKRDIESILHEHTGDISYSLRRVIEDNFKVELIEISNDEDRYATPEYFEVSRANVPHLLTTRPAVIDFTGRVLIKGLYLVPLVAAEDSVNH